MRILLVEDDKNLLETLSYQLTSSGFDVDTCDNGEDALYYMEENIHDLILLDRMLPLIDGVTLLKKIRSAGNETPVILLTALGELNDKITGLDSGADDYLVKPFAFEELLARIRSIFRRPRRWQDAKALSFGDISWKLHALQKGRRPAFCIFAESIPDAPAQYADFQSLGLRHRRGGGQS